MVKLSTISVHQLVSIQSYLDKELEVKLLEFGLTINSQIRITHKAPFGGPIIISTENGKLALRQEEASTVLVNI